MTHIDQLHHRTPFIDENGLLTPFAFKFLTSVWERTGGPDDAIEETQVGEIYESGITSGELIDLDEDIEQYDFTPQAPVQMFTAVTKNSGYTANPFEFIAVIANATIKLPANPDDNDTIIVLNVNGSTVITDGNGKGINDDTSTTSTRKNTGIVYQYFIDLDKWYMR